jgi:hypothetical protein
MPDGAEGPSAHSFRPVSFQILNKHKPVSGLGELS